jgi:predicted O-methyltransferase YrrM
MSEPLDIVHPQLQPYLEQLAGPSPAVAAEMEAYARAHDFPIVGPQVGRLLRMLAGLVRAERIFELGSGFGYSALWLADALGPRGRIECTETNPDNISRGRAWLQAAGVGERVTWHGGDALAQLRAADGAFDLIFNDIDKEQYPEALRVAWPRVRPGGLMITDNVLWSGRVVTEVPPADSTAGILEFTRDAFALMDAHTSIVPLRDGLLLAWKLPGAKAAESPA